MCHHSYKYSDSDSQGCDASNMKLSGITFAPFLIMKVTTMLKTYAVDNDISGNTSIKIALIKWSEMANNITYML